MYGETIVLLQNLSSDPVLLPSVEGFGVEHDVSAVARLGAGNVAFSTQLHPRHSQNRPGQMGSGSVKHISMSREMEFWDGTDRHGNTITHTCRIR